MMRKSTTVVLGTLALLSTAVAAIAQAPDPFVGVWKLNLTKSTYDPGPPPKGPQTRTIELVGEARKFNVVGTDSAGNPMGWGYTANYDGKDVPLTGTGTPNGGDTLAITHPDAYTTRTTIRKAGKVVNTATSVVSKDGKVMTTTNKGTNESGRATNNVTVWERQVGAADALVRNLLGTWSLNLAKSTYSPGPPPRSLILKWEPWKGQTKVSFDGVDAQGQATHMDWVGVLNGTDQQLQGAPAANTTRSYKAIDGLTFDAVDKVDGKVTTTTRLVVARDGETRTFTITGTNAQGQAVRNVLVYGR